MNKIVPYIIFATILICFLIIVLSSKRQIYKIYNKFLRTKNSVGLTGKTFVFLALEKLKFSQIKVSSTKKPLSDAYIPSKKIIVLSEQVLNTNSICSLTIISHELGHAKQDYEAHPLLRLFQLLSVITNITSKLIFPFLIVGAVLSFFNAFGFTLLNLSILFFCLHLAYKLLKLPLEKDASKFAKQFLIENEFVTKKELKVVKRLLNVAYLTYVASFFDGIFLIVKKVRKKH